MPDEEVAVVLEFPEAVEFTKMPVLLFVAEDCDTIVELPELEDIVVADEDAEVILEVVWVVEFENITVLLFEPEEEPVPAATYCVVDCMVALEELAV